MTTEPTWLQAARRRDALSVGGGGKTDRKLLLNALDTMALRLAGLINYNPVFRSKPIGAPHSPARLEQETRIAIEDEARRILADLGYAPDGRRA